MLCLTTINKARKFRYPTSNLIAMYYIGKTEAGSISLQITKVGDVKQRKIELSIFVQLKKRLHI